MRKNVSEKLRKPLKKYAKIRKFPKMAKLPVFRNFSGVKKWPDFRESRAQTVTAGAGSRYPGYDLPGRDTFQRVTRFFLPSLSSLFIHPAAKFGNPKTRFCAKRKTRATGAGSRGGEKNFPEMALSFGRACDVAGKFFSESEKFFVGDCGAVGCAHCPARQKNFRGPLTQVRRVLRFGRKSGRGSRMRWGG